MLASLTEAREKPERLACATAILSHASQAAALAVLAEGLDNYGLGVPGEPCLLLEIFELGVGLHDVAAVRDHAVRPLWALLAAQRAVVLARHVERHAAGAPRKLVHLANAPAAALADLDIPEVAVVEYGLMRPPAEECQHDGQNDQQERRNLHPFQADMRHMFVPGLGELVVLGGLEDEEHEAPASQEPPCSDDAPHVVQHARREQVLGLDVGPRGVDPVREVVDVHAVLHHEEERGARERARDDAAHDDANREDADVPGVPVAPGEHPSLLGLHALAGRLGRPPRACAVRQLWDLQQRVGVRQAGRVQDVAKGEDPGHAHELLTDYLHKQGRRHVLAIR
mmetsp:Transcript_100541/g.284771  ORF Transcript_100541/g.284771 Transcript_100541/m.284771 type:complete len:340 (-) Transcript_100541:1535-2554(-)